MSPESKNRSRWLSALIVLVIVIMAIAAVLIGSRIYANNQSSQAADAPTLSPPASGTSQEIDGTWTSTSGSYAGYRLDEVLNGSDVTVTGRTEEVEATLNIDTQTLVDASVTIDVASISTDSDRRDNYFRSSAIDVSQYPEATFTLLDPVDVAAATSGSATFTLNGELTINGQTQVVSVAVDGAFTENNAQLVGQIPVTWTDFGVTAPNMGFVSVEDTGFIEFSLNMTQA